MKVRRTAPAGDMITPCSITLLQRILAVKGFLSLAKNYLNRQASTIEPSGGVEIPYCRVLFTAFLNA